MASPDVDGTEKNKSSWDCNYQAVKSKTEKEISKEHILEKLEDRSEDCILKLEHWQSIYEGKFKTIWRGLPLMKTPFEIVTYQQMMWDIKPRTILEFGSNCGGSATWMADIMKMFGGSYHVYSMDIDLGLLEPLAREKRDDITFIEGDSNEVEKAFPPDLLKELPHPWIVTEDVHINVDGVLEYLNQFVEPGDYIILEDTNPCAPDSDEEGSFESRKGWGRWKLEIVINFVKRHPDKYRVDKTYTDFFGYNVTNNLNSYLRCM